MEEKILQTISSATNKLKKSNDEYERKEELLHSYKQLIKRYNNHNVNKIEIDDNMIYEDMDFDNLLWRIVDLIDELELDIEDLEKEKDLIWEMYEGRR